MSTIKFKIKSESEEVKFNIDMDNKISITDGEITNIFNKIDSMKEFATRVSDVKSWMISHDIESMEAEMD